MSSHGLRFQETRFWVRHRRREYGPFDYEWSRDLGGMELMFRGEKFGEYCSPAEIYADLKTFRLPKTVAEVGSIVLGCVIYSVLNSLSDEARQELIARQLLEQGYRQFAETLNTAPDDD